MTSGLDTGAADLGKEWVGMCRARGSREALGRLVGKAESAQDKLLRAQAILKTLCVRYSLPPEAFRSGAVATEKGAVDKGVSSSRAL